MSIRLSPPLCFLANRFPGCQSSQNLCQSNTLHPTVWSFPWGCTPIGLGMKCHHKWYPTCVKAMIRGRYSCRALSKASLASSASFWAFVAATTDALASVMLPSKTRCQESKLAMQINLHLSDPHRQARHPVPWTAGQGFCPSPLPTGLFSPMPYGTH